MNNPQLFEAIKAKADEHNIDIDFLYPAVVYMGENILASEDDIFRAYFNSEVRGYADAPPEAYEPASDRSIEIASRENGTKPIAFFIMPGERINKFHIEIYKQLLWIKADVLVRFVLEARSNRIDKIIYYLCGDVIQSLRNARNSSN